MPAHIYDNIKKLNPEYNYLLLDFDDGKEIIRREFHDVLLKDKIINAMRKFKKIMNNCLKPIFVYYLMKFIVKIITYISIKRYYFMN